MPDRNPGAVHENAARVNGIDVDALAAAAARDDLSWTAQVAADLA